MTFINLSKKDTLVIVGATMIVLAGCLLIRYCTQFGPWTMVDTVDYFDVAHNLSNGNGLVLTRPSGLTNPMTIHPPLYTIVLAIAATLKLNLLRFTLLLNFMLFAVTVITVCLGTYRFTSSTLLSISAGLWLVTNRAILRNYSAALSEPLFLTTGIVSIYLLWEFIKMDNRWLMFTSALLAGLALLTRYSGVAFLVTGFITIMIWQKTNWHGKLKTLASYVVIAASPMLFWLAYLRIYFPSNTPGTYEWVANIWQAMTPFHLAFINWAWEWLGLKLIFPTEHYSIQAFVLFLICIVLGFGTMRSIHTSTHKKNVCAAEPILLGISIWATYTVASIAILLLSYIFVRVPKPWLDERLFSPIQTGTIFTILLAVDFCGLVLVKGIFRYIPLLMVIVLIITANTPNAIASAQMLHDAGEGYTSWVWEKSTVIDALQSIPPDKMIVSNDPGAILFFSGRASIDLIPIIDQTPKHNIPDILLRKDVAVVLFKRKLTSQFRYIYGDETGQYIEKLIDNLPIQFKGNDGTISYTN